MGRGSREQRVLAAVHRVLDHGEEVVARGRCWAVVRRPRVPLLFLGRHQYDVVLTDRRLMLFARRGRSLRPSDVALVKRFSALALVGQHQRVPLLQQRLRTDGGSEVVVEWQPRHRRVGVLLGAQLERSNAPLAAPA